MFRTGQSPMLGRRRAGTSRVLAILLALSMVSIGAGSVAPGGFSNPSTAAAATLAPRYQNYPAPGGLGTSAGEPSIGVNWNTGAVMYEAGLQTLRVTFDDATSPAGATWLDKSAPNALVSLDPILFTDHSTGRTITSQLTGQDSLSAYSDDDGNTWTPSQGGGIPSGVDHQTVGGGPYAPGLGLPLPAQPYQHAVYYCSQDIATAFCARSDTGGLTFGPGVPVYTAAQCNGLHGHVKVGPTGIVYVPNNNCGFAGPLTYTGQGAVVSTDNGLTWNVYQVVDHNNPNVQVNPGDSDPSIGVGSGGRVYFGFQNKVNENGVTDSPPFAAVSDDNGQTWHNVQRLGADLGINNAVFPATVAGDNDRAAVAYLGTTTAGDYQATGIFPGVWHLYISTTLDGGQTWTTVDATPTDPVQRGSICTGGTTCGNDRNLLDFIDATIDAQGRVLVGYADGCIGGCVNGGPNSFSALATIARQSGGARLFAQYDPSEPALPGAPLVTGTRDGNGVHLSWPQPDDGGSSITGYNIYRGTSSGQETLYATIGNVTTYNDTNVNANTAYYYQVAAVNSVGTGPRSPEVSPTAGPVLNPCTMPGVLVSQDLSDSSPNTPPDPSVDIKSLYVAEPYFADGSNKLVFTLQLGSPSSGAPPPSSQWYIMWNRPSPDANFDRNYVAMKTDALGNISYEYGQISPPDANLPTAEGAADAGFYDPGTITSTLVITVANSKLDGVGPGSDLPDIQARTFFARPNGGPVTQTSSSDYSPLGNYTLVGNAYCRPQNLQPDLTITGLEATQNKPKQTLLTATVANTGTADASNVVVRFKYDNTTIGDVMVSRLARGASASASISWDTRSINGTHTITAIADPDNAIAELNESNNQLSRSITIRGNKVTNGSYEQSTNGTPTNWTGSQGTGYDQSGSTASDGTRAVSATGNGSPAAVYNPTWTSSSIPVSVGQTYNLAMNVTTHNLSSAPGLQVVYMDGLGNVLGTVTGLTTNLTGNNLMQEITGQITIPAGVSQVQLRLLGFSPADLHTNGTVYFDDVWMW